MIFEDIQNNRVKGVIAGWVVITVVGAPALWRMFAEGAENFLAGRCVMEWYPLVEMLVAVALLRRFERTLSSMDENRGARE